MIKAVIFDQDGIIFDNEPITSKSYDILLRSLGKEPIVESHRLIQPVGLRGKDIWEIFRNKYGIDEDIESLNDKRRNIHLALLEGNLEPMSGLLELLSLLKSKQIRIALATGTSKIISLKILNGLGIREYFDVLVNGEDFTKGKPNPECFILTSEKLGVCPEECIVIEDSMPGVEAAKAAGMKVIAVPTTYSMQDDFSKADKKVSSLQNISWKLLSNLSV